MPTLSLDFRHTPLNWSKLSANIVKYFTKKINICLFLNPDKNKLFHLCKDNIKQTPA